MILNKKKILNFCLNLTQFKEIDIEYSKSFYLANFTCKNYFKHIISIKQLSVVLHYDKKYVYDDYL